MTTEADKSLQTILKSKGEATIAIFDRGEHYGCYGEDATFLANEVFKSDICIRKINLNVAGSPEIPFISLGFGQYQRVIRELIMFLRHRVELYGLEDGQWKLKAKGTIGNTGDFDDIIADVVNSGSTVMAISITGEDNHISASFWDLDGLRITTTEFNDTKTFSQIEQCIVGMNPRECLLVECHDISMKKKFSSLLFRMGVLLSEASNKATLDDAELFQLFKTDESNISASLKYLLKAQYIFFNMDKQEQFTKKFILVDYKTSGFMHIDGAAVKALEIFNLNYFNNKSSDGTLFSLLNKCKSAGGQRLLRDWIARPLCDLHILKERQDVVSALVDNTAERITLQNVLLSRVPDIAQLSRKLLKGKAKLQDCFRIYQLIALLGHFEATVRQIYENSPEFAKAVAELLLEPIGFALSQFDRFGDLIRSTVDVEHFERTGSFRIKPSIDPDLLSLSNKMDEFQVSFEKAHKKACKNLELEYGTLKLDSSPQYGYFFRISLKEEKNIRKHKDINIIATNKSSGVLFRDANLSKLNENYQELNKEYMQTQENLEQKVVETCAGYATSLSQLSNILSTIDVCVAFSTLASESASIYVRPKLKPMGSGVIELHGCRHPVLERSLGGQFIPNDVLLNKENRLIVLTGANMGGKSTYLRSAALCVLLAQIGSYVPASSATISIVDGIFTRVGASDQQTKGISTFMAEMLDSSSILEAATENSLVIVDELGRGTSTFDGFGLAWALASDILKRIQCLSLFATHFHEMAELEENEGCTAYQMTVDVQNDEIAMLYQIKRGCSSSSFGLVVCKMVNFPENVIQAANNTLKEFESNKIAQLKSAGNEELRSLMLSL